MAKYVDEHTVIMDHFIQAKNILLKQAKTEKNEAAYKVASLSVEILDMKIHLLNADEINFIKGFITDMLCEIDISLPEHKRSSPTIIRVKKQLEPHRIST